MVVRERFLYNEVYGLLQENQKFEGFLETICEHEIRYGYLNGVPHKHGPRTDRELEVLEFLKEHGISE